MLTSAVKELDLFNDHSQVLTGWFTEQVEHQLVHSQVAAQCTLEFAEHHQAPIDTSQHHQRDQVVLANGVFGYQALGLERVHAEVLSLSCDSAEQYQVLVAHHASVWSQSIAHWVVGKHWSGVACVGHSAERELSMRQGEHIDIAQVVDQQVTLVVKGVLGKLKVDGDLALMEWTGGNGSVPTAAGIVQLFKAEVDRWCLHFFGLHWYSLYF